MSPTVRSPSDPIHFLPMPTPHAMTFAQARPPLPVGRFLKGTLQRARRGAVVAALCVAWAASPALAQAPSIYQGYLDECLANRKSAQDRMREGIAKATAEGNTARVDMLTQRLESNLATTPQKCETFSRDMADKDAKIAAVRQENAEKDAKIAAVRQENAEKDAKIAAADAKIAALQAKSAALQAKSAALQAKSAELRKINEGFQQFNTELPQLTRDLEAVLAGKITGGQREAVIKKLQAAVVTGHDLIRRTRAMPSLQTPENIALLESFERSVQKIESSLRSTARP